MVIPAGAPPRRRSAFPMICSLSPWAYSFDVSTTVIGLAAGSRSRTYSRALTRSRLRTRSAFQDVPRVSRLRGVPGCPGVRGSRCCMAVFFRQVELSKPPPLHRSDHHRRGVGGVTDKQVSHLVGVCCKLLDERRFPRSAGAASDELRSDHELLGFGTAIDAFEQETDASRSGRVPYGSLG